MNDFKKYLLLEKKVTEYKLKTIERALKKIDEKPIKGLRKIYRVKPENRRRITKTDLIGKILEDADRPMNLKEIEDVAKKEHNTEMTRDSMSSILSKKVRAGKTFIRTGPNEFYLRKKVYD
jgi:hypothetical protein